jgi:integrase
MSGELSAIGASRHRARRNATVRVRLQLEGPKPDLALFNLAIDSKLRGCDLVALQVGDVCVSGRVRDRGTVIQKKTGRPVQFEITEQTRSAIRDWVSEAHLGHQRYLFPSRVRAQPHLSTRQYARIVDAWVRERRARQHNLRHPLDAADKGGPDLSQNGQPTRVQLLLGQQSWRAPSGIPALRSMTRSASPNRSNSRLQRPCPSAGPHPAREPPPQRR